MCLGFRENDDPFRIRIKFTPCGIDAFQLFQSFLRAILGDDDLAFFPFAIAFFYEMFNENRHFFIFLFD